jgi:hypothetical protein
MALDRLLSLHQTLTAEMPVATDTVAWTGSRFLGCVLRATQDTATKPNASGIFMLRCSLLAMKVRIRRDVAEMPATEAGFYLKKKVLARD